MIIFAIAAALSSSASYSTLTPDEQQVVGANREYEVGDTRHFVRSEDTYNHKSIKPKKKFKRLVTLVPQTNGLDRIIARVKRENGIKTKS
jgi:hypothetical protein